MNFAFAVSEEEWRRVAVDTQRLLGGGALAGLRPPAAPLGAPLLLSPRAPAPHQGHQAPQHPAAALPLDHQLVYAASPYADYAAGYAALAAAGNPLLSAEYAPQDHTGGLMAF